MSLPTYMSGLLFTKAHKVVRGRIYQLLEKYELNPTYWSILSVTLQSDGGVRLSKIAEIIGVKAPLVTLLANDLITKGFVKRIPHHTDKRAKLLIATPQGKKFAASIETELHTQIMQLLDGLQPAEIVAFQKTLETIIANSNK